MVIPVASEVGAMEDNEAKQENVLKRQGRKVGFQKAYKALPGTFPQHRCA